MENAILTTVKRALDISADTYDAELGALIDDAVIDLAFNNFDVSHEVDATVQRAINLFCGWQFNLLHGDTDRAARLEVAYNSIKTQMGTSSKYGNIGYLTNGGCINA